MTNFNEQEQGKTLAQHLADIDPDKEHEALDRTKIVVQHKTLCTGHKVFHATHPECPMVYGEGKTKNDAIADFIERNYKWITT